MFERRAPVTSSKFEARFGTRLSGCLDRMGVAECMEIDGVLRYAMRTGRLLFQYFLALAWVKEYFTLGELMNHGSVDAASCD